MSTTNTAPPATQPIEKISIARYHLTALAFFVIALLAQYAFYIKYVDYIPEDLHGVINLFVLVLSIINSGFMVSVIPLGMVFIFGWLYLMDMDVEIRKLYQITILSTIPIILLMLGSLLYTLVFMKIDAATSQQLKDLSAAMLEQLQRDAANVTAAKEWTNLLETQRASYATVMSYLSPIVAGLSCLICGSLLYQRLKLAAWKAFLIPISFAAAVFLARKLTSAGAGQLMDNLKELLNP